VEIAGESKFSKVKEDIRNFADSELGKEFLESVGTRDDLLVLFRSRGSTQSFLILSEAGMKHRVRISGHPSCLHPWVGELFWDFSERTLTRSSLKNLASQRTPSALSSGQSEVIWSLLKSVAQESKDLVNMHQLRRVWGGLDHQ